MKFFMSYYSDEEADAEDIRNHLITSFHKYSPEIFMASRWDSIADGVDWETKIINAVNEANLLMVLISFDSLTRPWINFEIGVAWAKSTPILLLCHKGIDPAGLPKPYGSLQAINLSGLTKNSMLNEISNSVSKVLGIEAVSFDKIPDLSLYEPLETFYSVHRRWSLRPTAHLNETSAGIFLVGAVRPADAHKAKSVGMTPGDTLTVRLFLGLSPEGKYINALVSGALANYFEKVISNTNIAAKIKLATVLEEGDNITPLYVVDDVKEISVSAEQNQQGMRNSKLIESL